MADPKPPPPRLTATESAALLGTGFAPCSLCQGCIVRRLYAFEGGPKNGPEWRETVALNPVTGSVHQCEGDA